MPDIHKFSLAEACSNNDGKTSGTKTIGLYTGFIAATSFLLGVVDKMFLSKSTDVMVYTLTLFGVVTLLLTGKNYLSSKNSVNEENVIASTITKPEDQNQ